MENKATYFPQLDGLRFFAFLAVFIHHAPVIKVIPGWKEFSDIGWVGVDLFLCLSAFLFVYLLEMEYQRTGGIKILMFYIRRALRIWPAYFLTVTLIILISYWEKGADGFSLIRVLGLTTFTDNILSSLRIYNPLNDFSGHLWTISYEEQVYLFIPIFLSFVFPRNSRFRVFVILTLLAIGTVIRALFIHFSIPHPAIWELPVTHFESVLLGLMVGLGLYDQTLKKLPGWMSALMGMAMLGSIALLPYIKVISWHLMVIYPLVGLGTSLLVYSVVRFKDQTWIRWIGAKPLAYLGKISYGLYLYHLPTLVLVGNLAQRVMSDTKQGVKSALIFVLALAITLIASIISFEVFEKPFLVLKKRFSIILSRPV